MKLFLWFLAIVLLFPVSPVLAEPVEDAYEDELRQKCDDLVSGKKNDTPKNPISKFLSSAKKKLGSAIAKRKKSKDDTEESPFSLDFQSHEWEDKQTNDNKKDARKVNRRSGILNKIRGDSLKKLGLGTPVYCTLAGVVSHSGIAMGDKIIHLDGNGTIIITSPQEFIDRLDGKNPAVNIYYAAYASNRPVEFDFAAARAVNAAGKKLKYNVFKKNCHGFTIWCFTGKYTSTLSISKVEDVIEKHCGTKWTWRCWDGWR